MTKLVEVTAAGIGTLYRPFGTIRQAKADAKAKVILSKADVEILTLEQRAKFRLEHRETLRQENIERIVLQAADEMPANVSNESVDKDWILQFFWSGKFSWVFWYLTFGMALLIRFVSFLWQRMRLVFEQKLFRLEQFLSSVP